LRVILFRLESPRLSPRGSILAPGETRIASLHHLASLQRLALQCKAVVAQSALASLDEAKLPTQCRDGVFSEATLALLCG